MSLHDIKGLRARQTRRQLLRNATTVSICIIWPF